MTKVVLKNKGVPMAFVLMMGFLLYSPVAWGNSMSHSAFPTPQGYVNDYADILPDQWTNRIRFICQDVENRVGVEMIVVTVPTIKPFSHARAYASQLYANWRIGSAQQERGIVLLMALKEKQAVVVLGRSLLSVISPSLLDEITAKILVPMFRTGDYGQHLYQVAVQLAEASGRLAVAKDRKQTRRNAGFWMNLSVAVGMVFVLWRFLRPERRHPFQRWRRGEFWGTGQGGFGGNFGGFGGGMSGDGLG